MEIAELTAVQALGAMRAGELSCLDYAWALIDRNRASGDLNALIGFDEARFVERMRSADEKRWAGARIGPLHGLPLLIKDNIDVVGFPTTGNTPTLKHYRPASQGPVVQALQGAGAVVMAKANLHELALGPGIGRPAAGEEMQMGLFGPVLNPHDPTVTAGGSSSGSGAAIAARIAPAGLGTDTGGSVRKPASFCGVVGFRPSTGRYSQKGVITLSPSRDTIGLMARAAGDVALLDACVSGAGEPPPAVELKGLRMGVLRDFYFSGMDGEVAAVIDTELTRLADFGVDLIDLDIPGLEDLMRRPRSAIVMYECRSNLARYLAGTDTGIKLAQLIAGTRTTGLADYLRALGGPARISKEDYRAATGQDCPAIRAALAELFQTHRLAALVAPSCLVPPIDRESDFTILRKGVTLGRFAAEGHNSGLSSIAGLPSVTLPAGLTGNGLPVGISFDGAPGADRDLLAIAQAYEAARPPPPGPFAFQRTDH
jgi:mandelamide amidase